MGQFLKGNSMGPIKIHNGGNYYRMHIILMLITSVRVKIQLILQRTFIGQFLKGSNMGPIKISNRGKLGNLILTLTLLHNKSPILVSEVILVRWYVKEELNYFAIVLSPVFRNTVKPP